MEAKYKGYIYFCNGNAFNNDAYSEKLSSAFSAVEILFRVSNLAT